MTPSTFDIPSYPVPVNAEPGKPIQISPGPGPVFVDGKVIKEPITVTHAVALEGEGTVTLTELEPPVYREVPPLPDDAGDLTDEAKADLARGAEEKPEPKKKPRPKRPSEIRKAAEKAKTAVSSTAAKAKVTQKKKPKKRRG